MGEVWRLYDAFACEYDRDRPRAVMERGYLSEIVARLAKPVRILDLGCGCGEPIARFFIDRGFAVTGIDAAPGTIAICRERFADAVWIEADMRSLDLVGRFAAIIAWDSFFHLTGAEQRAMFPKMTGRKRATGSDLRKLDAHKITPEEYRDIPELTDDWFEKAEMHVGGKPVRRGRPKSARPKEAVTIRLDPDILESFRATGRGWQTRINAILAEAVRATPQAGERRQTSARRKPCPALRRALQMP